MEYVLLKFEYNEPKIIKEVESENLASAIRNVMEFKEYFDLEKFIIDFKEDEYQKFSLVFKENIASINEVLFDDFDFEYLYVESIDGVINIKYKIKNKDNCYYLFTEKKSVEIKEKNEKENKENFFKKIFK